MRATRLVTGTLLSVTAAFVLGQFQSPVSAIAGGAGCSDIASMALPGATITSATEVREPFSVENGRNTITVSAPFSFCRVALR